MKYKLIIDKNAEEEVTVIAHAPSALTEKIEALVNGDASADFIMGYRNDEMCKLPFEKIECITVLDRRVLAIDENGDRFFVKERLRDLEGVLPPYFVRINKSTIANELRIARFGAAFSGGVDAYFYCGYRDYVSRRCFAEIRRRYE